MWSPGEFIGAKSRNRLPAPWDESRHIVCPDYMPGSFGDDFLAWGCDNGDVFRAGDPVEPGHYPHQSGYHLEGPQDFYDLDAMIVKVLGECRDIWAELRADGQPAELTKPELEMWSTVRGDGDVFHWHTDDDFPYEAQTRRLTFCYYIHTRPRMFMGGELEMFDGTLLSPEHNALVWFHPSQAHRVRHVHAVPRGQQTWADFPAQEMLSWKDARWNISGWVHDLG